MKAIILAALGAAALVSAAGAAHAAKVRECDGVADASNIAEPWEKSTKVFYNGKVRVALLYISEPACCGDQLLILSPDNDPEGDGRACHLVANDDGQGFGDIGFENLTAAYDAKKGLLISFPYSKLDLDGTPKPAGTAHIRINVASGSVTAEK
ncbi:MAG TPA: hypothetical protein VHW02_05805 [Rhizomicrobium sp.]|jgi:opacity protein-like surface antigen|nr:hypothetical protein [Rhizomicrobium sp.]